MRSALAGTASNVVALKTTAAVPMSVTERMFHLLCGVRQQQFRSQSVPKTQTRNLFRCAGTSVVHIYAHASDPELNCSFATPWLQFALLAIAVVVLIAPSEPAVGDCYQIYVAASATLWPVLSIHCAIRPSRWLSISDNLPGSWIDQVDARRNCSCHRSESVFPTHSWIARDECLDVLSGHRPSVDKGSHEKLLCFDRASQRSTTDVYVMYKTSVTNVYVMYKTSLRDV